MKRRMEMWTNTAFTSRAKNLQIESDDPFVTLAREAVDEIDLTLTIKDMDTGETRDFLCQGIELVPLIEDMEPSA